VVINSDFLGFVADGEITWNSFPFLNSVVHFSFFFFLINLLRAQWKRRSNKSSISSTGPWKGTSLPFAESLFFSCRLDRAAHSWYEAIKEFTFETRFVELPPAAVQALLRAHDARSAQLTLEPAHATVIEQALRFRNTLRRMTH
jgi:hypothetical protein